MKGGNKASGPEGLICDLHAKTDGGIPEDDGFSDKYGLLSPRNRE